MQLEQHVRLCPGVLIPSGKTWASKPMKLNFLRYGSFHVRPDPNQQYPDPGGCLIKIQGSNVYPINARGVAIDWTTEAQIKNFLDLGSPATGDFSAFTNLGWADMGISFQYPAGETRDALFAPIGQQGQPIPFDYGAIRIVVSGPGPSGIPLEVWAKFKSGGG